MNGLIVEIEERKVEFDNIKIYTCFFVFGVCLSRGILLFIYYILGGVFSSDNV